MCQLCLHHAIPQSAIDVMPSFYNYLTTFAPENSFNIPISERKEEK